VKEGSEGRLRKVKEGRMEEWKERSKEVKEVKEG
jgi:hypothetical protein